MGVAEVFSSDHNYFGAQSSRVAVMKGLIKLLVLNNRDDTAFCWESHGAYGCVGSDTYRTAE